ncbi:hypothetical protein K8I28_00015, partial [bacterium]|nr:hypothetical protein [bacterium]
MSHFTSWALRFFMGGLFGILLFMLTTQVFLSGTTSNSSLTLVVVYVPLVIGILLGFLIPDVLSTYRWRKKWLPVSTGKITISEFNRESVLQQGIRVILGAMTPANKKTSRLREFVENSVQTLITQREMDDWVWEFYHLGFREIERDSRLVESFRQMLLDRKNLNLVSLSLGLRIYNVLGEDEELAYHLGMAALKFDESVFADKYNNIIEDLWLSIYLR